LYLTTTYDVATLVQSADEQLSLEPVEELSEPVPLSYPYPILVDSFTYQAFDGELYSEEANVTVVRGLYYLDVTATDA
jgi:hypothetical protein